MATYYVYRVYSNVSGKSYIGFTHNPEARWRAHVNSAANPKDPAHSTKFKRALRKNGADSFVREILFESCDRLLALDKEKEFISKYDSFRSGYNSTIGGEGQASEILTIEFIVDRAKEFFSETGTAPSVLSGSVIGGYEGDTWAGYNISLSEGYRGLPGGSSLAALLTEKCGFTYQFHKPNPSVEYMMQMADAHKLRTGKWPGQKSGTVVGGYDGDTWAQYERLLTDGGRGLPGGSSLAKEINSHRSYVHSKNKATLTYEFIVSRAQDYYDLTGKHPSLKSVNVPGGYPGDTWNGYDRALFEGHRGLPGGTTLKKLLSERLGAPNHMGKPALTEDYVVELAKQHKERTGKRPSCKSGSVIGGHPGDTWNGYQQALQSGGRGFPGGSSLSKLLKARGVR